MGAVLLAFGKSLASQFKSRVLLLMLPPLLLATMLWGGLLWLVLQPIIDAIQRYFAEHDTYLVSGKWLTLFGLAALKTVIVPLLALWTLLPMMVVTALTFVGIMAMPAIVRHIAAKYYPDLERRHDSTFVPMLWVATSSSLIFVAVWIVTIPLCALPLAGFVIQPLLWGWLTSRVIAFGVLVDYADTHERKVLLRRHRWSLLAIGAITGVLGAAPTLLWLSRASSILLSPIFALLLIWLYVILFTFSVLWFAHFGLVSLGKCRAEAWPEAPQMPSGG